MLLNIERKAFAEFFAKHNHAVFCKFIVVCIVLCVVTPLYAVPLRLHVDGNKVKDPNGNIVILRGVALTDLGSLEDWKGGALNAVDRITNPNDTQGNSPGWYTKIIRIVIAPPDSTTPPRSWPHPFNADNNDLYNLLRTFVDYCAEKEVYVAIDWHYVAHTYDHVASTSEFWRYMAPRFKDDTHVIYELFNEPNNPGGSDAAMWTSVKNDMQTWIDIVRGYAPDNLIFVGTPSYCQIIGPTATAPVNDVNAVYISHIYPLHWLSSSNQYYRDTITAAAAAHPVIMGEWGFTSDMNYDDPYHIVIGTQTNYGKPIREFVEGIGIGSIAWCAGDPSWGSPMFYSDGTLRVGEGEMGGFAKDWLYEASGVTQNIDLNITNCKVTAGKTQGQDVFEASGTMASSPVGLYLATQIDINIVSLADGSEVLIYPETIEFNSTQVKKGKYKYTYKIPGGGEGAITSLTMDFNKKTFAIKTKNIDLTGLVCPLQLNIRIGNYALSGDVDETIVNGQKTIPTRLMRMYKDTLIVTKAKVKNGTSVLSDSLSVSGEIAVKDINDANMDEPNLVKQDVNIVWGNQTFTIPAGRFEAARKGHSYKCSKINVDPSASPDVNDGIVTATIDLDKCTFAVSIAKANINAVSGDVVFGLRFADFNETDGVNLVLGH
jgi:endoglucanase